MRAAPLRGIAIPGDRRNTGRAARGRDAVRAAISPGAPWLRGAPCRIIRSRLTGHAAGTGVTVDTVGGHGAAATGPAGFTARRRTKPASGGTSSATLASHAADTAAGATAVQPGQLRTLSQRPAQPGALAGESDLIGP